jgi:hypothetical protein
MTTWVVEQGEYSDYRVVGVFSSEANARLIADAVNREQTYNPATVAEWPMDPAVDDLNAGRTQWLVWMRRDGTVERCDPSAISGYGISGEVSIWRRHRAPAFIGKNVEDCLQATIWATDGTHAIKIANEHRARLVATGEWDREPTSEAS